MSSDAAASDAAASDAAAPAPRKVVCRVKLNAVTLKLTLNSKLLAKPLTAAVLTPFLNAYNKKAGTSICAADLDRVTVDGAVVAHNDASASSGQLLPQDTHDVELFSAGGDAALDVSDGGGAPSNPVERVIACLLYTSPSPRDS